MGRFRFCSAACERLSTRRTRRCAACGEPFEAEALVGQARYRKTCSPQCAKQLIRSSLAKTLAGPRPKPRRRSRPCVDCPTLVLAPRKRCEPCLAVWRAEQLRAKHRRRRALKRGGVAEPYTLAEIAARDGHRCQLCRRKVDMTLTGCHPKAPSIDHVIPIDVGGDDTRANVQLAHFGCNSRKGVRGSQQLALVG